MSWEMGSAFLGLGLALFSLVSPMMGLTMPRWLLSSLLGLSVLLLLVWPVSFAMTWVQDHYKMERSTGLWWFSAAGAILGGLVFGIIWHNIPIQTKPPQVVPSAEEIAQELRGGKSFCYFSLYSINNKPQIIDGKFQLAMTGVGVVEKVNYWISPAGVEPTGKPNDPYYSIDSRKTLLEIVHDGGRAWDRALPLGEYRIDFAAKNGNWYERLKIYMSNGEVKQSVTVTNAKGDVIYDSESPKKK